MKKLCSILLVIILLVLIMMNVTGCEAVDWLKNGDKPRLYIGIEEYIDSGREKSSYGITKLVIYSETFLTNYQYLKGDYSYYINGSSDPWYDGSDFYECCIFELKYESSVYWEAKKDLMSNTSYSSAEPMYNHNGFEFYVLPWYENQNNYFFAHSFNDEESEMILLACYANSNNTLGTIIERGGTWLDFLDMYFGEFYDFNA